MTGRFITSGQLHFRPEWVECCWPQCTRLAEGGGPPLCPKHYEKVGVDWMLTEGRTRMANFRPRADPNAISQEEHLARRAKAMADQSQVYYVRIGDHVKIGYTINMRQRMGALRVAEGAVLATEPGGRELEKRRHQQFAPERVGRREDFNPSRRLLQWIEVVREEHGPPKITTYRSGREVA